MIVVTWAEAVERGALRDPDEDPDAALLKGTDHLDARSARARGFRRMAGDAARERHVYNGSRTTVLYSVTPTYAGPPAIDATLPGIWRCRR